MTKVKAIFSRSGGKPVDADASAAHLSTKGNAMLVELSGGYSQEVVVSC